MVWIKRSVTGLLLAGVVIGMLFSRLVGYVWFDLFILLALFLSLYEMIRLFRNDMTVPAVVLIAVYALAVYPVYRFLNGVLGVALLSLGAFLALSVSQLFDKKATQKTVTDFLFMLFYPTLILTLLFYINNFEGPVAEYGMYYGLLGIVIVVVSASFTDIFALFAGKAFGHKKLCPSISPNKTVAGAIGGFLGGIGGTMIVWAVFREAADAIFTFGSFPAWALFLTLGAVGSVMDQLGDLVASNLKRTFGVKDFGMLLPGHGGLIDRIDGILFTSVMVYAFFMIAF